MLGSIRDKATGWIAGTIVGMLVLSFAFWGVSSYVGGGGKVNVAKVNDAEINLQTFQRSFTNLRRQMRSIFGDELTLEEEELIRQQTIKRLVESEIINQIVKKNNLRVTDEQVAATITNLELFRDEEGFDRIRYEQGIANLGMDPVFFEQQLRMDLLSEQLQAGIAETLFVTSNELEDVLRMKNQTRDITYAILGLEDFVDDEEVSANQIETYYSENQKSYVEPEKVKIAYIDLDVAKIAEDIEFSEQDLRDYYQNNKGAYDVAEQRSVTKLSVKIDEEATEEDMATARQNMDKALTMVNEGMPFAEIIEAFTTEGKGALEFSEHAFMTRGIMGEEIDEFLFSNDENATSGIIETKSGLNIVKVGEIRGGPKNVFEKVAEQVENDYKLNQAELKYFEMSDQLTTLAYEHPDTLEIAAETIGVSVQESAFFSRDNNNKDVTSNDRIIDASFKQELIDSGQNSDAIELGDNHIAVIRVIERQPAAVKPLEQVREEIIADIKRERAKEKIREIGQAIITQLVSGVEPTQVDSRMELNWNTVEGAKRDATNVTRSVLRNAFQMVKPQDQPSISGYSMGSGDYAIVMVTAAQDGDIEEVAETTSTATDNDLRRIRGATEWREFLNNARESAKVKIFEENI